MCMSGGWCHANRGTARSAGGSGCKLIIMLSAGRDSQIPEGDKAAVRGSMVESMMRPLKP